jgi:hypothetical protein
VARNPVVYSSLLYVAGDLPNGSDFEIETVPDGYTYVVVDIEYYMPSGLTDNLEGALLISPGVDESASIRIARLSYGIFGSAAWAQWSGRIVLPAGYAYGWFDASSGGTTNLAISGYKLVTP